MTNEDFCSDLCPFRACEGCLFQGDLDEEVE
jgi:hypothetical protein